MQKVEKEMVSCPPPPPHFSRNFAQGGGGDPLPPFSFVARSNFTCHCCRFLPRFRHWHGTAATMWYPKSINRSRTKGVTFTLWHGAHNCLRNWAGPSVHHITTHDS